MIRLNVKVQPSSSKRKIIKYGEDTVKVYLFSAPEKGKANKELKEYLSEKLKVSKSNITIIRGQTAQIKILEISGLDEIDYTALMS